MEYVSINDVREGMIVCKDITEGNGCILLKEDIALTSKYIERLKKRDIKGLYVYSCNAEAIRVERTVTPKSVKLKVTKTMNDIIVDKRRYNVATSSAQKIEIVTNKIVEDLINIDPASLESIDNKVFEHSLDVAKLSMIVGLSFDMTADELYFLGLSAILHDLPKLNIPEKVAHLRNEEMTKLDRIIAKSGVMRGCQEIKSMALPEIVKNTVVEHSNRIFNDELPVSKLTENTSKFAEIIGLCDIYDDMSKNSSKIEAAEYVLEKTNELFKEQTVEALMKKICIYPEGTLVKLNDGRLGTVIDGFKHNPVRPTVNLLGTREMLTLDTFHNKDINIIQAFNLDI